MKFAYRATLVAVLLAGALCVVGFAILESRWFHAYVHNRLIALIEENTGGKAEFGDYQVSWRQLRVRVQPFVLRGKEDPSRDPFVRIESAEIGLKILSLWRRDIDLRELRATRPELHIYVDKDGNTNLPSPARPSSGKNPVEEFFRLAVETVELRDGVAEYDSIRMPLSLNAQGVTIKMSYAPEGPKYLGDLSVKEILLDRRYKAALAGNFVLEGNRLVIESARVDSGSSSAEIKASLKDFKTPSIEVQYKAALNLKEFPVRPVTRGRADLDGVFTYSEKEGWKSTGLARIADVDAAQKDWQITSAAGVARYLVAPQRVELDKAELRAFGGTWQGKARIWDGNRFEVQGVAAGIELGRLATIQSAQKPLPWDGAISGPVEASGRIVSGGVEGLTASLHARVDPLDGQLPISGEVDASYDQKQGTLNLGSSYFKTKDSRLNFRGVLGRHVEFSFRTVQTADLEPIIRMLSGDATFRIPVSLSNGDAEFTGTVDGRLEDPVIRGHLVAHGINLEGHVLDRVEGDTTFSKDSLEVSRALVAQGDARVSGNGRLALANWRVGENPAIRAALATRNVDVARVLKENRVDLPLAGRLSATMGIEGTLSVPQAGVRFVLDGAGLFGDRFQRITGRLQVEGGASAKFQGNAALDQARLELGGEYRHQGPDWKNGGLDVQVKLDNFNLESSERLQSLIPKLRGKVAAAFTSSVEIAAGQPRIRALDGTASASAVGYEDQQVGDISLSSRTTGGSLALQSAAALRTTQVHAAAAVALSGNYPAKGSITVQRITFRTLADLAGKDFGAEGPPVRGFLQAKADFDAPLLEPRKGSARIIIDEVRVRPRDTQIGDTAIDSSDLTVRNDGPIELTVTGQGVQVKRAKMVAKETDLTLEGGFLFNSKTQWDARLNGKVNLDVLTTFNPDLVSSGNSVINATLRGSASNPELSGRLEINNGSFFLRDVPNGIDKAQGVILFDRNRATIEKLTGQTGGGTFDLRGFVSLSGDDLLYRLQAIVSQVRIRYPEGVSTTLDADLSLTGSAASSLLTGTITVQRSGFNPRGDIGSIFREPNRPVSSTIAGNRFLRGMQFDVRVRSAPNAFFQSAFTQETQIEADLHLRGSPVKPIVLGSLTANAGEVEFFGNRYTITRGEILFFNTAVIQPVLDIDVETRIRGITVYINVNGPLDRINVTYRSEPPLSTNEIVALLTVGRTPGSISGVPQGSTFQYGNVLEQSSNTLLGGALSGALSSRMERFFGVSRVKIDPGVTSLEGTYQSRLTIEQSVSKDVTVTFSTNLAKTQQQVISAEWNFSRAWSAVLTRNDNGVFSIEFRLRKQFK